MDSRCGAQPGRRVGAARRSAQHSAMSAVRVSSSSVACATSRSPRWRRFCFRSSNSDRCAHPYGASRSDRRSARRGQDHGNARSRSADSVREALQLAQERATGGVSRGLRIGVPGGRSARAAACTERVSRHEPAAQSDAPVLSLADQRPAGAVLSHSHRNLRNQRAAGFAARKEAAACSIASPACGRAAACAHLAVRSSQFAARRIFANIQSPSTRPTTRPTWIRRSSLRRCPFSSASWPRKSCGSGHSLAGFCSAPGRCPSTPGIPTPRSPAWAAAVKALRAGMPLFVFPEGGRTSTGELQPVPLRRRVSRHPRAGAAGAHRPRWRLRSAAHSHAPLLSQQAHARVGEPIETKGMTVRQIAELTAQLRASIEELLQQQTPARDEVSATAPVS